LAAKAHANYFASIALSSHLVAPLEGWAVRVGAVDMVVMQAAMVMQAELVVIVA